jgi:hypothetical protein
MFDKILSENDLCVNDIVPLSLKAVCPIVPESRLKDSVASHVLNEKTDQERFLPSAPIATKNTYTFGHDTFPGAVPRKRTAPGFVSGQGVCGDQFGLFSGIQVPFEHVRDPRDPVSLKDEFSYLDSICLGRGGSYEKCGSTDVFEVLGKSACCGDTLVKLWNLEFEEYGYLPIDCKKWWCPVCGGKKGKIHNTRIVKILERVNFEKNFLRQFVFTLPESVRFLFKTRKGLNSLIKLCVKIVKKYFPRKKLIMYLHINGDRDPGKFHPHVNVHVVEGVEGVSRRISMDTLENIKSGYLKAVRAFLKDYTLEKIDVYYSYRVGKINMSHSIRYMLRPYAAAIVESKDEVFKELAVMALQNFPSIRYYGFRKGVDYIDDSVVHVPKGYEFICLVSRRELNDECKEENKILVEGDDGLLYLIDRFKGS